MKTLFLKILYKILKLTTILKEKLEQTSDSKLPYISLTATKNAEKAEDYLNALKWALNNRFDIKNIAITGSYGSGKSSVIKTFIKQNEFSSKHSFLNISLATFKVDTSKIENIDETLRLIELSILQQLFYHEVDSKVPDSRFTKIVSNNRFKLLTTAILSLIFVTSFLFLTFPKFLSMFSLVTIGVNAAVIFHYISVIILILGLTYIIYKFIRVLKNITIKNIGISDTSIELESKISKSILNHHLDEIIYFFEVTSYNTVIFEDLDRFEQSEIFTKLREINLLINNSKKIKRDIVFIYAIKDDMFNNKNRAKFFDFIIPIIPVINSSNSKEKLIRIIQKNEYKISDYLLDDISLFIDDMRLLYNIMNEYHIYQKKLNNNLNQDKLLAIIVYKNLCPNDFTFLDSKKGVIHNVFMQKNNYIKNQRELLTKKIEEIKDEIKILDKECIYNIKELRLIYLSKLISNINMTNNAFNGFIINGKHLKLENLVEDENFKYIRSQNNLLLVNYQTAQHQINHKYNFKSIEQEINPNLTYDQRENNISNKDTKEILKHNIIQLEKEKNKITKLKLKDLLQNKDIQLNTGSESQKELVKVLLLNGYIDEDFNDYISIFYEGSLSKNDHTFLINIKTQQYTDFDFTLHNKENLIKRISDLDFEREYILNNYLLEYLLESKVDGTGNKAHRIFDSLSNESKRSIQFIDSFIKFTNNISLFMRLLCEKWTNIWTYLVNESNYPKDKLDDYLNLIIENNNINITSKIFKNSLISFCEYEDLLTVIYNIDKLKEIISELDLKFKEISEDTLPDLIDFIYNGSFYEINYSMLKNILSFMQTDITDKFDSENYTFILNSQQDKLLNYIDNNINKYIENVYLSIGALNNEPEDQLLSLLNNDSISNLNKELIIKKTNTKISDLEDVHDFEIVRTLILESKILCKWSNLISTYKNNECTFCSEIISYINNVDNAKILSEQKIPLENDESEKIKPFLVDLIKSNEINNEGYGLIISSIPYIYTSLNISDLSDIKIETLVSKNKLVVNEGNFKMLKNGYQKLAISLLENNTNNFLKNIESFDLVEEDILDILKSEGISSFTKEKTVNSFSEDIFINDQELLTQLGKLTLDSSNFKISTKLVKSIILNSKITVLEKVELFNKNLDLYSKNEIDIFLKSLGNPYSAVVQKGKRPLFEFNKINNELSENLKSLKYISKYKIENKGIRISTFRK